MSQKMHSFCEKLPDAKHGELFYYETVRLKEVAGVLSFFFAKHFSGLGPDLFFFNNRSEDIEQAVSGVRFG